MPTDTPPPRRAARVPFVVEVTVASEHNFWSGFTYNVSMGGIFISTDRILPVGSLVTIELNLPPDEKVHTLTGEVRWIRELEGSSDESPSGIGLQFSEIPSDADARIKSFILEQRDSLFYDDED